MIQYLPAIASLAGSVYGAIQEGKQRRQMAQQLQSWKSENEALYNQDYYGDYLKRADSQRLIKNMRDETRKQNQVEQNTAAVTGASPEAINAAKDRRNRAMTNVYSNISAMGEQWKDRAKNRYLSRKQALQGMEYDIQAQQAQSANNLLYNGLAGIAATDWTGIMKGLPVKTKYNTTGIEHMFNKDGNLKPLPTPKVGIKIN